MASQDLIELTTKLYTEGYNLLSKKTEYRLEGTRPTLKVTVILEKDGKQLSISSSEVDFLKYATELRSVTSTTGEHRFARVRNPSQYNADLENLVDADRSRIKEATENIRSGKFTLKYNPSKLIDEFLKNERNVKDEKYLPLKKDYHYILASIVLTSGKLLKAHRQLMRKYPEARKVFEAIDAIMKGFWQTGNAVKDYRFYKRFVNFDMNTLAKRMSTQLPAMEDTVKDFLRRGDIDAYVAIPKMMNIYGRLMELLTPAINVIRIGLELRRGNTSPDKDYGLTRNIVVLKSDVDYGPLFGRLDEQIRHADAHASILIDKAAGKVQLIDTRSGKGRVVGEYTFDKFADAINVMQNEFFPIIYPTLMLFDIAALGLLLASREYKSLLLALGNS
jgi:hypothetical protein